MTSTTPARAPDLPPIRVAGRAAAPAVGTWQQLAKRQPGPGRFDPARAAGLPEAARRWLTHAIAAGTPLARAVILEMEGHIRIGRCMAFRAVQLHAPPDGYVWAARAALGPLRISDFDRYEDNAGEMRWRLLGHLPVLSAADADLDRSAAGRVALDAVFVPTAFLVPAVTWREGPGPDTTTAAWTIGSHTLRPQLHLGPDGGLRSVTLARWAKPAGQRWGEYPCGGTLQGEADIGGIKVPTSMRVGYFFGTDRWHDGEFLRARITNATFI